MSLADAKQHLRVDSSDDDDLITALIGAATSALDGWSGRLGRCLITQTWQASWRNWCGTMMVLPFPDVSAATVKYFDSANAEQTIADSNFRLIERAKATAIEFDQAFAMPAIYNRADAITVTMTCGYGDTADEIPAAIIAAAKLAIGAWYENREETVIGQSSSSLPQSIAIDSLLLPFMRGIVG